MKEPHSKKAGSEPLAKLFLDEMAPGISHLTMTIIKPFCRWEPGGVLGFFGLLQVADSFERSRFLVSTLSFVW